MLTLLPKLVPPQSPKQLRPIDLLASHVSKAYARLIVGRLENELKPQGEHQLAGKGRQATDFIWFSLYLSHICREWKTDGYLLKLDLQRAFDSVDRVRLAHKICDWSGKHRPYETRSLIRLLASSGLVLQLPWCQREIVSNVGVKQGATESPLLFARLIDDVLSAVDLASDDQLLPDLCHDSSCFMDDIMGWKRSVGGLQRFVDKFLPMLSYYGLEIQPKSVNSYVSVVLALASHL